MILAGVMTGNRYGEQSPLHFKEEMTDIYDVKGAVEAVFTDLRLLGVGDDKVYFSQPAADQVEPVITSYSIHYTKLYDSPVLHSAALSWTVKMLSKSSKQKARNTKLN